MKDNFSHQSDHYAQFRPKYPQDLFDYINSLVESRSNVWDCGTGNGQIAIELSKTFEKVFATDISQQQIEQAPRSENIFYSIQAAEKNNFENDFFDLIIVAQAVHWFEFSKFYSEVNRTGRPNSRLILVGYGRIEISIDIDKIITNFYQNKLARYWDTERRYIDEMYRTIPFPFEEIEAPNFEIKHSWTLAHFIGYINTWSAVKHCIRLSQSNPVEELSLELKQYWAEDEEKLVRFPLFLRIGIIK